MQGGFDWSYVVSLFGDGRLWAAALVVLELSVSAWLVGVTLGMGVALLRRHRRRASRWGAGFYIWLFRNVPLLVLIVFIYNAPLVFPGLHGVLSIPFWSAFFAIALTEIAYTAEIHRGGLVAVGPEQVEAGFALGLSHRQVFLHVVLPQALRVSIPSLRNDLISIVKLTSLASVISLPELLYIGQEIYSSNFKVLESLLVVTVFYIGLVAVLDGVLRQVERHLDITKNRAAVVAAPAELLPLERRAREIRPRHPHDGPKAIEAVDLAKSFDGTAVLDGLNLSVHEGEVVAVIGPSGSGKTTLIRTLNLLEAIDGGTIVVQGVTQVNAITGARAAFAHRRRVGMVFQRFNLFPHRTVLANLTMAPRLITSESRSVIERRAYGLLHQLGLEAHTHKYPHQLSGGQQQRVAIARALMMEPSVVLFDEPTSALDRELVGEVLDTIRALAVEGLTMVVISHELRFVEDVADWVVFMEHGRVVEEGTPEVLMATPSQPRTRAFLGHAREDDDA